MKEKEELVLSYKNIKERLNSFLVGILLGLFVIIPGVSGATLLILFGLYKKVAFSISHFFQKDHFKKAFFFLLPIILGTIIGLVVGLILIQKILNILPFTTILLFAGLLIGSLPVLFKELKGTKPTNTNLNILALGFLFIIIICFISIYISRYDLFMYDPIPSPKETLANKQPSFYFYSIIIGFVIGITQVIPGLSASAFLMMIGCYSLFINSISFKVILAEPKIIFIFFALIIGFILGLIITNKVIYSLLDKHKEKTNYLIVGFSLASIVAIFLSKEIFENVYIKYFSNPLSIVQMIDVIFAPIFLIGGIVLSTLIIKKQSLN